MYLLVKETANQGEKSFKQTEKGFQCRHDFQDNCIRTQNSVTPVSTTLTLYSTDSISQLFNCSMSAYAARMRLLVQTQLLRRL